MLAVESVLLLAASIASAPQGPASASTTAPTPPIVNFQSVETTKTASAPGPSSAPEASSRAPLAASATLPSTASSATERPSVAAPSASPIRDLPKEEKPVDWWARGIGAAGLLVAGVNFIYGIRKTRRDRRLSIEDDFWFRKIITPTTIEPMLKAFVDLLDALPSRQTSEEDQRAFALKITKDIQRLNASVQTLALFNEDLPGKVAEKLRACEDTLTEHSSALTRPVADGDMSRDDVHLKVWKQLNDAMRAIQQSQLQK